MIKQYMKKTIGKMLYLMVKNPSLASCLSLYGVYTVSDEQYRTAGKLIDLKSISGFSENAKVVIENKFTLLGYDRLYTLYQALWECSDGIIVESGAYKGGSAKFMSMIHPTRELYVIDTFKGHAKEDISIKDPNHKVGYFNDASYDKVVSLFCGNPNVHVLKGRIQDVISGIPKKRIGVLHLDMDIYAPTKFALDNLSKMMISGGIIVIDDYGFKTCDGVRKAVDEFLMEDKGCFMFFHLTTGQAMMIKR